MKLLKQTFEANVMLASINMIFWPTYLIDVKDITWMGLFILLMRLKVIKVKNNNK